MCSDLSLHNKTEFILAKVHRAVLAILANLILSTEKYYQLTREL